MNERHEYPPTTAQGKFDDRPSPPMYFPVSLLKLAVMSICTFGLYQIYWFYKNWRLIQIREELSIAPVWRAFFANLFCYSLFTRIQDTAESQELPISLASGFLASGFVVTTLFGGAPGPYWLITLLSAAFLLPVQSAVNDINQETNPEHNRNIHFSGWNIAIIFIGGILFLLTIIETISPNGITNLIFPVE